MANSVNLAVALLGVVENLYSMWKRSVEPRDFLEYSRTTTTHLSWIIE